MNSRAIGWLNQGPLAQNDWDIWDTTITTALGLSPPCLTTNIRPQSLHPLWWQWEWFLTDDLVTLILIEMSSGAAQLYTKTSHLQYTLNSTTIHLGQLRLRFPLYAADTIYIPKHIEVLHYSNSLTLAVEDGPWHLLPLPRPDPLLA